MSSSGCTAHIVRVGRDRSFTSGTLPVEDLSRLEAPFQAARWWRDRWWDRAFRSEARRIMRERGGLILIGPGIQFDIPDAFDEFFEAIEISSLNMRPDERLKSLSGEKPTREERFSRYGKIILIVMGILFACGGVVGYFIGIPWRIVKILGIVIVAIPAFVLLVLQFVRLRSRVYLVPGGVAVVRRPPRKGRPPRITVFSRRDTVLTFRLVSNGKTVTRLMELWTPAGGTVRRGVSQREAMSAVAVWMGDQAPLDDDRLVEVVSC